MQRRGYVMCVCVCVCEASDKCTMRFINSTAKTRIFWEVREKYLEGFVMWYYRTMEKISWTDRLGNEVLRTVKERRNILHTVDGRKANWIGHVLCSNCLLTTCYCRDDRGEYRSEGKTCKKLVATRWPWGNGYWEVKEETLDGPLMKKSQRKRQNEWMNKKISK